MVNSEIVAEIERELKNINLNYVSVGSHPSYSDTNKKLQDAEIIKDKYNFVIKNLDDVELGQMISIDSEYGVFDEDEKFEENNIFNSKTCTNNIEEKINVDYTKHKLDILLGKRIKEKQIVKIKNGE